jgi:MFS family permease
MAAVGVTDIRRSATNWRRVGFAMFAVAWGANQFSPLLIVYRHDLRLGAGVLAGLFGVYAAALIPGLLIGGPVSDRVGRRPVVIPFVAASPVATLLLMIGPRSLPVIVAGRALAGLCSGVVFGSATAWVQELSDDPAVSARRSAVALCAGFGLGPAAASMLAQWAGDPLVLPYLPHLVIGVAGVAVVWRAPETGGAQAHGPAQARVHGPTSARAQADGRPSARAQARGRASARAQARGRASARAQARGRAGIARRWLPRAVRTRRFWLAVAPAAPWVFGSATLAFVVLPQEVTSAGRLSVGFAGLVTTVTVGGGLAVQPLARRLEGRRRLAGNVAGLGCMVAGSVLAIAAVTTSDRAIAIACAVLFGGTYGLCLVSGLRESERLADRREHGAVVACFYVLTYVGFAGAYLADGLNAVIGRAGTFVALAVAAALTAMWTGAYTAVARPADRAGADGAGADGAGIDRAGIDRAGIDRAAAEHVSTERTARGS